MPETSCLILFENNPKKFYYAGEMCRGTVTLVLYKVINVREIYLKIEGEGYVRIDFLNTDNQRRTLIGKENYLSKIIYFLDNNERTYAAIKPGKYVLPFECRLPINLPSSIDGVHGHIRYKVTFVITRYPLWSNKSYTNDFTVFKRMNLNEFRIYLEPIVKHIREDFRSCFPCFTNSGLMTIAFHLTSSAYIPGERINIKIVTNNNSNVSITNFRIQLIKFARFRKSSRNATETSMMADMLVRGCNRHANSTTEVKLPLNQTQPTDIILGTICKVYYELKINAVVDRILCNPYVQFPITIGTPPSSILDVNQIEPGADNGNIVDSQPTNAPPSEPPDNNINSTTAVASSSNHFYINTVTPSTSTAVFNSSNGRLTPANVDLIDPPAYAEASLPSHN